jgi:predicted helicase
MNLTDLLDKLTLLSASFSQQGTAFERMMGTYLQTDPLYSDRFEKVFIRRSISPPPHATGDHVVVTRYIR